MRKIFNAHRLVQYRFTPKTRYAKDVLKAMPASERIKYEYTPDVVNYIQNNKLAHHQKTSLLHDPAKFFSNPNNVPPSARQQVYLPDIVVTLIRTPHLPPKYAAFWVPLWFNKSDMKDYLLRAYGVKVIHIRSYVQLQRVYRVQTLPKGRRGVMAGSLKRPGSKKKMTVELLEPFAWPEELEDFSPWERETFEKVMGEREEQQHAASDPMSKVDAASKSIAEQAKAVLEGKMAWKPTWQSIPLNHKAFGHPPRQP